MSEDLVSLAEAAKRIGICKRRVLTELIRTGLLPYPTNGAMFRRADVDRVVSYYAKRRAAMRARGS